MIEVAGLRKEYKDTVAVDDVSFVVEKGEIFGLLGPNGAGKSTAIGCICGLLRPTAGEVRVLGHDVVSERRRARERLGVVPQELALYMDLSARENLSYWGAAWGLRGAELESRVREVLEIVSLTDRSREAVKNFSGGMQRRLNFGCGIVHQPQVLLLDEPTVGVDPQSRVKLLDLVRQLAAEGTCVLYTTHYMEEAEGLCDRLAILDRGRMLATGDLSQLRGLIGERDLLRFTGRFDEDAVRAAAAQEDVEVVGVDESSLTLALSGASGRLPSVFEWLGRSGSEIRETTLKQPSLESLFIKLTGRELRE